jgi:hypothetical protein
VTRWHLTGLDGQTLSRTLSVSDDDVLINPGLGPADVLRVAPDGTTVKMAEHRPTVHTIAADGAVWVHDGELLVLWIVGRGHHAARRVHP